MAGLEERIREQIRRWRDDLINLSRLNRLLYFRHTKTSTLEVDRPGPREILSRLETLGARGWRFYVPPAVEEGQAPPTPHPADDELLTSKPDEASLLSTLRALERKAAQEFMDKGLWVLYLGVGMLEWVDPDDEEKAHSPIWLVPVTVQRENPREPFHLRRAEEDALVNPALAVKLSSEFGIDVPPVEELEDTDPDALLALFTHLVDSQPEWRVTPRVVLSTFSFHKEVMYRDLLNNEEQIASHALVRAIALGSAAEIDLDFEPVPEEALDEQEPPEEMVSILDADASQRQCIVAARAGHSFVMDGPPGTGKSQTIANIIAELLTHGKRVLFVSEKAAALEVVQSRLDAAGLGEYILALHSHKATRREVAQELGRALTSHPRAPRGLGATEVQRLVERRRELSAYARALNEVRLPLETSLHSVIGRISELQGTPSAPPISILYETLNPERFAHLEGLAAALGRAWGPVEREEDFLWRDLRDSDFGPARINQVRRLLENAKQALADFERVTLIASEELRLPWTRSIRDSARLIELLHLTAERPVAAASWLTSDSLDPVSQRISHLKLLTEEHRRGASVLEGSAGTGWRHLDPDRFSVIEEAVGRAGVLEPSWLPPSKANSADLEAIKSFLAESESALIELKTEAVEIARRFGLAASSVSLKRARELAELGALVGAPSHPEGDWLNPAVLAAVRSANEILKVLVEDYGRRRHELSEVFADSVLELQNLKDLCVRFETLHRGFGRFRKQCRQDRKVLAPCTRAGKVKSSTARRLRDALAWQELTLRLTEAEKAYAVVLGSYYRREATDFDAVTGALRVAQRALDLAGRHLDVGSLRKQLARGSQPDPDLLPRAEALLGRIEAWEARAEALLEGHARILAGLDLAQASIWCREMLPAIASLSNGAEHVSRISGGSTTLEKACEILRWRRQVELIEKDVGSAQETDIALLGAGYSGLDTDWAAMEAAVSWAQEVRSLIEGAVPRRSAERILASDMRPEALSVAHATWEKRRDEVASLFSDLRLEEIASDLDASFEDGRQTLDQLEASTADIQEWLSFSDHLARLNEEGLEPATTFCIEQNVPAIEVAAVVEKSLLEAWVDHIFREHLGFGFVSTKDRDRCVEEFRDLDRQMIAAAASRVINACNERRPRTMVGGAGINCEGGSEEEEAHADPETDRRCCFRGSGTQAVLHDEPINGQPVSSTYRLVRCRHLRRGISGNARGRS